MIEKWDLTSMCNGDDQDIRMIVTCGMPFGIQAEELKRDCFFYDEDHNMGATIPCCSYHGGYGNCPCDGCEKYF